MTDSNKRNFKQVKLSLEVTLACLVVRDVIENYPLKQGNLYCNFFQGQCSRSDRTISMVAHQICSQSHLLIAPRSRRPRGTGSSVDENRDCQKEIWKEITCSRRVQPNLQWCSVWCRSRHPRILLQWCSFSTYVSSWAAGKLIVSHSSKKIRSEYLSSADKQRSCWQFYQWQTKSTVSFLLDDKHDVNEQQVIRKSWSHTEGVLAWCISMYHVIGLKRSSVIKNVTLKAAKKFVGVAVYWEE